MMNARLFLDTIHLQNHKIMRDSVHKLFDNILKKTLNVASQIL